MKFLTNHTLHIITLIFFLLGNSDAREAKEYDNDVNYEETKIPHYDLPELLIGPDGKKISSTSEWEDIRRPQILSLYSNLCLLYTSPSPRDVEESRMPSSA